MLDALNRCSHSIPVYRNVQLFRNIFIGAQSWARNACTIVTLRQDPLLALLQKPGTSSRKGAMGDSSLIWSKEQGVVMNLPAILSLLGGSSDDYSAQIDLFNV